MKRTILTALFIIGLNGEWLAAQGQEQRVSEPFDLVLAGGRVMDPASGLDAVRNVGIRQGRISIISETPVENTAQTVDITGLVVAPGFIDLHAHGQDLFSSRLQAQDGVTTALELEGGTADVAEWYEQRRDRSVIHYGATVSHGGLRARVVGRQGRIYSELSEPEIQELLKLTQQELDQGGLGIGFGLQYIPGASRLEVQRLFALANRNSVGNFVHVRFFGRQEPGSGVEAIQEMIANAGVTGASVHVVHIGSSGLGLVPELLEMIDGAQRNGLDVTTEVYPYTAASTDIRAAIFDPGWRERTGGDFSDLEWVATGERLTEETFEAYRQQGGMIIAHIIPEAMVEAAVGHAGVMIASDGVPFVNGRAHPRGAGTFSRVLGLYVREKKTLDLMDALEKMTLAPARRLEKSIPSMRFKGRIRVGADADITVFNPAQIIDRATFEDPAQPSAGIHHVLVAGTFVVRDGKLDETAFPGRPVRR